MIYKSGSLENLSTFFNVLRIPFVSFIEETVYAFITDDNTCYRAGSYGILPVSDQSTFCRYLFSSFGKHRDLILMWNYMQET